MRRTKGKARQNLARSCVLYKMDGVSESRTAVKYVQPSGRAFVAIALVVAATAGHWWYGERGRRWAAVMTPRGSVRVQIADSASDRSRGLARRDEMPGDGLLLQWDVPGRHPIWMKEMRFPLDLIWLERGGRVVGVLKNVPVCPSSTCPLYEPDGTHEAEAVLELAAGAAAAHGIELGTVIRGLPPSSNPR